MSIVDYLLQRLENQRICYDIFKVGCLLSGFRKKKENSNGKENKNTDNSKQFDKPLICFQCGEKLIRGDKFCFNCGETTEDELEAHHNAEGGIQAIKKFKNRDFS